MPPEISIIIPVCNAERTLRECLDAVARNRYASKEVILVDDGSTDSTVSIAGEYPVKLIHMEKNSGPSAARNRGASEARGDILFFIDSDVVIPGDALDTIADAFSDTQVEAVTGLFCDEQRFGNFASEYKNLWMHYTYKRIEGQVALFYTSGAAIRKDVFFSAGEFDEGYRRPSVEDTDFGHRLRESGHESTVAKGLTVEHIKRYSLLQVLRTDYLRASALVRLFMRRGLLTKRRKGSTSVPGSFVWSIAALFASFSALVVAGVARSWPMVALGAAGIAGFAVLNAGFLSELRCKKGLVFMLKAIPAMMADTIAAGLGVFAGVAGYVMGERY